MQIIVASIFTLLSFAVSGQVDMTDIPDHVSDYKNTATDIGTELVNDLKTQTNEYSAPPESEGWLPIPVVAKEDHSTTASEDATSPDFFEAYERLDLSYDLPEEIATSDASSIPVPALTTPVSSGKATTPAIHGPDTSSFAMIPNLEYMDTPIVEFKARKVESVSLNADAMVVEMPVDPSLEMVGIVDSDIEAPAIDDIEVIIEKQGDPDATELLEIDEDNDSQPMEPFSPPTDSEAEAVAKSYEDYYQTDNQEEHSYTRDHYRDEYYDEYGYDYEDNYENEYYDEHGYNEYGYDGYYGDEGYDDEYYDEYSYEEDNYEDGHYRGEYYEDEADRDWYDDEES